MFENFWFLKYLIAASVPLLVFSFIKKKVIFKNKPYLLYFVMALPTSIVSGLLYLFL